MMEMTREMAIGKIHRAVVTGADPHYVGPITGGGDDDNPRGKTHSPRNHARERGNN